MGRRIAIGDIHGCYLTLRYLLEEKVRLQKGDSLFFTGDYIDRGPKSKEVLDYLMFLSDNYSVGLVRGNHEQMLLDTYSDISGLNLWMQNGAEITLNSIVKPNHSLDLISMIKLIPENYIEFLSNMPCFLDTGNYIIVHAGLNFDIEDPFQDKEYMLWARNDVIIPEKYSEKKIIHGHTPQLSELINIKINNENSNVINLDSGCVYTKIPGYGVLTAFDMDSRTIFLQKNIEYQ